MPNVDGVRANYRRVLEDADRITLRRISGTENIDAKDIPARIVGYGPQELSGTIMQGDSKVVLMKEALDEQGFPVPPKKGDKILLDGEERTLTVQFCDPNTRRIGTDVIAYEIQARGS